MNNSFEEYSDYYDIFYTSKNYTEECKYIESLVAKHGSFGSKKILDLGCGTGNHSIIHASNGWSVTGIDRSPKMIEKAKEKSKKLDIKYYVADITSYDLKIKYEVITAMFAVVSYLTTNEQLINFFKLVKKYLKQNGVMIFDSWYGPAVLHEKPSDRYKIFDLGKRKVIRFVKSELLFNENVVTVDYNILVINKNKLSKEINEQHRMRYLFVKEIELILSKFDLQLVAYHPFLNLDSVPDETNWNVTFVVKHK